MKTVLIAYFSTTGKAETMAEYIAEGLRISGLNVTAKKIGELEDTAKLYGYDGFIFGSPTFSLDIPGPVKAFITRAPKDELTGKLCGAFGSYTHDVSYRHDTHAPALILEMLRNDYKMKPCNLGSLSLQENLVATREGIKACQDYGRVFGDEINQIS